MHTPHPVTLVVNDDLQRSRLTVGFRLILFIPHIIWFVLWTIGVAIGALIAWVAALVLGQLPARLHNFFCAYIRYSVHLAAYITFAANPYPGFSGEPGYPVDVWLPEAMPQPRLRIAFRALLALPALLMAAVVGSGGVGSGSSASGNSNGMNVSSSGLSGVTSILSWFASLFTGRTPKGLRDVAVFAAGYQAQTLAYLLLVTPRYPCADPVEILADVEPPSRHAVRMVGDSTDLRRSRVTVLFRLPIAIPHLVWLVLWGIFSILVVFAQWFITLFRGYPATKLHALLGRYIRYQFQVLAFLFLVANPFPGFAGIPGIYPLDLELPEPARQNRWKTGFRIVLAVPAWIVGSALSSVMMVAAILTWFASLAKGSAPEGLRNLSAYALRYNAQVSAYGYLLTDSYPHASPLEGASSEESDAGQVEPESPYAETATA